ncbi:MAG TPA: hypothetical protein VHV32_18845 [Candidatus Angelobacter sp.]|jgi:hypothetical protein|nr:hypothetical protein [Candidatus Angelobacter sp.]
MNKPQQADFILNHQLVQEFFKTFHAQIYGAIKRAKTPTDRDKLASYGRCADEFERFFRAYIESGKAEVLEKQVQEQTQTAMEKLKSRFPRW